MTNRRNKAAMAIAFLLVLTACATADPTATTTTLEGDVSDTTTTAVDGTTEPTNTDVGGGTVTVALSSFNREVLYPPGHDSNGLVYFGPMFDFLIGANPDGTLSTETGALESYEPNEDASVWTLTLRPGMTWHDGNAVTSADLEFTLTEYADPEADCGQVCGELQANLAGVEVVDDLTVLMNLTEPNVNIPATFGPIESMAVLLPKHHVEAVGRDGFESDPMGSGPWKFVAREVGQSITYEANRDYWDADRQPLFDDLNVVLAPDQNTRVAMLRAGEADLIGLTPDQVPTVQEDGFQILTIENTVFTQIYFFESWDPAKLTNQLDFRKALALAIDMDEVIAAFYPPEIGRRSPGDSTPFSPQTLGHDPNLTPYPYDPEEAERLLAEVGYDGSPVQLWSLTFGDNPEQAEVNEAIAGYWSQVGLNVEIVPSEFAQVSERFATDPPTWDPAPTVSVSSFPTSNRPSVLTNMQTNMLGPEAGGRSRAYWDPTKMETYFESLVGMVDEDERSARLQEINREIHEEYWTIPIALKSTPYAAGPRIEGWEPIAGTSRVLVYESLVPAP